MSTVGGVPQPQKGGEQEIPKAKVKEVDPKELQFRGYLTGLSGDQ